MAAYAKPIRPSRVITQRCVAAARATAGCTCEPDAELIRRYSDHAQHVALRHDDGCPALAAGRQILIGGPA